MRFMKKLNGSLTKASEKGKYAAAILQIKSEIKSLEKEMDVYYADLGRAYELGDESGLEAWMTKIKENKEQMISKRNAIIDLEPKKTICMDCGEENNEEAKFCGFCGGWTAQVAPMLFCDHCGRENEPMVKFCLKCGEKIGEKSGE